jgi:hypothetical protein
MNRSRKTGTEVSYQILSPNDARSMIHSNQAAFNAELEYSRYP